MKYIYLSIYTFRFCRGCKLECDQEMFAFGTDHIAIDWEPTALHLRYQSSQERVCMKKKIHANFFSCLNWFKLYGTVDEDLLNIGNLMKYSDCFHPWNKWI